MMPIELDQFGQPLSRVLCAKRVQQRGVDELLGICKGIIADGKVVQPEAQFLSNWLIANPQVTSDWPGNVIAARLYAYLADGVLDENEQKDLEELLLKVTGDDPSGLLKFNPSAKFPLDDPPPNITFIDQSFCLTGRFVFGDRSAVVNEIVQLGGRVEERVTKGLDYLIIGYLGSRDWLHSSFGTKIKAAVDINQSRSGEIYIVGEDHWGDCVGACYSD